MPVEEPGLSDGRRVRQLEEQQRAISQVLRAVAQAAGLKPVLDEIVEAARRLSTADDGALWLVEDGMLHSVAHQGRVDAAEYDRTHPHALDRTTAAGRAAVMRQPIHIPSVADDAEYAYAGPRPYQSMLGVPVLVDEGLIGSLVVVRRERSPFLDEEIELVQTFADQAAIALHNARLTDAVERQRRELARFLSPQVANLFSSRDGERLLAGHRAYITCLFCDLRGFTTFAETAAPEELFEVLRDYHANLGRLIEEHRGTLEHFAGDGVMIFFNDPVPVEEHELEAVRFALAARQSIAELAQQWRRRGIELGLGIGIEAGYATLGRIGFEGRYDYGALGPVTNLASRLSTQASAGEILIGQRVFAASEDTIQASLPTTREVRGFARPITTYSVTGLA
jgi:class 3 adenylate cyclase